MTAPIKRTLADDEIPPAFTAKQLGDRWGVSENFVLAKAYEGKWPHLRLGDRTVRFTAAHVEAIERIAEFTPNSSQGRAATRAARRRSREIKALLHGTHLTARTSLPSDLSQGS